MYTITYRQFQSLRTDPNKYWSKKVVQPETQEETFNFLVRIMFKNPKLVQDYFSIRPDVSKEDPKEVERAEACANLIHRHLQIEGEIDPKVLEALYTKANLDLGLPEDYKPNDTLIKYGEFLMIQDERAEITEKTLAKGESFVKRVRANLYHMGEEIESKFFPDEVCLLPKTMSKVELWLRPKICSTIKVTDPKTGSKLEVVLDVHVDYLMYYPDRNYVMATNIFICDSVTDFPILYKDRKLDQYVGFQNLLLKKDFREIKYNFFVLDSSRFYTFPVENVPDMTEEVAKALHVLNAGSHLPYEYMNREVVL